tara:strand:+ start:355 stop:1212 length:858 start_codon:yes stop_codon:yes gene_type:complete
MNVDLNIDNYNLDDLLNLFKLEYEFTEEDLKNTKKQVLKTHPDKSGLDKKYFLFFTKAYKMIMQVYYFRGKKEKRVVNREYVTDDREHLELVKSLDGKSIKEFNNWFNKMFDSVKLMDDESDNGYGDWMKEEVEEGKKVHLKDFDAEFNKKKKICRELALSRNIREINNTNGTNLSRDKLECYNSKIFSKLAYEDLKKAHTETVVPVTNEDFEKKKKFNSVEEYIKYRGKDGGKPLTMEESRTYLNNKETETNKVNMNRAYNLLKRDEELERVNEKWWKNFKLLK